MSIEDEKKINFKENIKIFYNIAKNYKSSFALLIFLVVILEISEVADKYLLMYVIDYSTEFTAGTLIIASFVYLLIWIAGIYLTFTLIKTIATWLKIHVLVALETKIMMDMKVKFFNHIISLSHKFHSSNKTGSLISSLIRGVRSTERLIDFIIWNLLPLILQLILVIGSLIYFDLTSAFVIIITSIIFLTYSMIILNRQQGPNLEANEAEDIEKANISDVLTNIETIKYFGKENKIKSIFHKITNFSRIKQAAHWNFFKWFDAGHILILGISTFFIFYFPLLKMLNGDMTIGTLVFIYTMYGNIIFPLYKFVHGVKGFYMSMADFQELFKYDKIKNDIVNVNNAKKLKVKKGSIEFKNLDFGYTKKTLLKNFNLKIKAGEKVALVGHSGCGKTTIIKLLYRLYDLDAGEILIDGKNITKYEQESLRSEFSIVPQEAILFDDTIYNNIAFTNSKAKKIDVENAMKFAQLFKIIKNFPEKEKTIVGERGIKLSGGEKQRVSIARAVLADKKILVLDEATSALDSETEAEIQKDLNKLLEGRTSIIIAHRLSTIMTADRIIVMDQGKIVQIGKHKNLIKQKGQYKKLWNLQKGGYIK
ncbi:MAG: ABC transporter ATP-binding protein [Nanoarchaeota archaeon]|nr:ABC transporter ATP-binding protein [Nanoarchaeota archaeon]